MNDHVDTPLLNDSFWAACLHYPAPPPDIPPSKRPKATHHAAPVICCDQPCPEETLCFQDYCHDYCPDYCTDPFPCAEACQDPCALQPCAEHVLHHQHGDVCADHCNDPCHGFEQDQYGVCAEHCHDPCTDACDFSNTDFCTTDCLDHCIDPTTACIHECNDWCTSHCLADCGDCSSSPSLSDVRTPTIPCSVDHSSSVMKPLQSHRLNRTSTPIDPAVEQDGALHMCRVVGCTAGCFKDENALQAHIEKEHLIKLNGKYVCQWEGCIKKVTKKSNEHIEREKEARASGLTYIPPAEPFSDDHLHKLKRHYYVHSGKKAFECDYPGCGSVHATKAQLKVHMARHNPKKFICDECEKVFTTQNQLKTHINAVHKKEKHFKCPDCDYACDDSSNMSSHKRKQHQLGVPCPGHMEFGCCYRDGRQAEMEKHMRQCGHCVWMLEGKTLLDEYWKLEKRPQGGDNAESHARRSSSATTSMASKTPQHRRQRKADHRRHYSVSTAASEMLSRQNTVESTPGVPDVIVDDLTRFLAGQDGVGHS